MFTLGPLRNSPEPVAPTRVPFRLLVRRASFVKNMWSQRPARKIVAPLIALIFLASGFLAAQTADWREMGNNKGVNFYDVQQDFYRSWSGKAPAKGQGYKVFKRWENYMIPRVYPSGDMRLPSMVYENYMKWKSESVGRQSALTASNWTSLGPNVIPTGYDAASGRIDFVRFDPTNSNTLFVGAPDGGLWKSTNGGTTWSTNTDLLTIIGVSDIVIDPTNTQNMYLATGNWESDRRSIGVLKSTDGGATWNTTSLTWTAGDNYKIRRLIMHPSNPLVMLAATDGGVFRTTDGWATNTNPYCCNPLFDIEFKPGDTNTVYACGTEVFRSTDGGATWSQITSGMPASSSVSRMVMAVTPANPSYVYIIAGNSTHGYLGTYRSTNSGSTFTLQSSSPNIFGYEKVSPTGTSGQAGHDLAIVVAPNNANLVTIAGINAWQSTDGGVNWTCVAYWMGTDSEYPGSGDGPPDYVHADIQDLQYLPGSNTTMFATADGGIYKSTNNGGNWTKLSSNLSVAQQTGVALSANSPTIAVCGEQDIGNLRLSGSAWARIGGGDGEDAFIHRDDNNIIVSSDPNGKHEISFDGGTNRTAIAGLPNGASDAQWFSPISQDPIVASTVYAGGRAALYRKTDLFTNNDGNWITLGTPPGTGFILRFVVAPSNNSIIYAMKRDAVSKSTDAGATWTNITGTLPVGNAMLSNITMSNTNANNVWVTFSGYSTGEKVFKTTNGGSSWTNISTGLPNIPVNTIVYTNGSNIDAVYLGADLGIYYLDNLSGGTWALYNTGLPNCAVTDLEIYYPTGKIRASTYGRGLWESPLNVTTHQWVGGTSNDWNTAANWSTGVVPSATDNVTLPASGVTNEATVSSAVTAADLTLATNRTLTLGAGGSLTVNGVLTMGGGNITLGNQSMTFGVSATVSGAAATKCIVTNGTGTVSKVIGAGASFQYPIGATAASYNPVTITNAAGPSETFTVKVKNSFDSAPNDPNVCLTKQWDINETTSGGNTATVALQFSSTDPAGSLFNHAYPTMYIGRRPAGGPWVATAATKSGSDPYTVSAAFTAFSPFAVTMDANALPVQLASFAGQVLASGFVELRWTTLSETNNFGFFVERKPSSGTTFIELLNSFIPGHGTTTEPQHYSFTDSTASAGAWHYRLRQVDMDGAAHYTEPVTITNPTSVGVKALPASYQLYQNYPNPFNPSTTIRFEIPHADNVSVKIYNVLGQEVATLIDAFVQAGSYETSFDGSNLPSGVYIYTMRAGSFVASKQLMLLK